MLIIPAIIFTSCLKNDQTCECTTSSVTKNSNGTQTSSASYTSIIKVKNATRNKAKSNQCADINTVNTYSNSTIEITTECNLK